MTGMKAIRPSDRQAPIRRLNHAGGAANLPGGAISPTRDEKLSELGGWFPTRSTSINTEQATRF